MKRDVYMKNKPTLIERTDGNKKDRAFTPEFYRLYYQSVLLALKEDSILNETQYQLCIDMIAEII